MDEWMPLPGTQPPLALQRRLRLHHGLAAQVESECKVRNRLIILSFQAPKSDAVNPGSTWGQAGVKLGSTWCHPGLKLGSSWGQPGVNLGSTWGQPGVNLG
jgi:hypothetical protein